MPFPKNSTSTPFKPTTHAPKVNANPKANAKVPSVQRKVVTNVAAATTTTTLSSPVSQSNEENMRPIGQADEQASKLELLSPLPTFGTGSAKAQERDVRAYEHERQRSKRAGELAVRRAKKAGAGKGKGGAAAAAAVGDLRRGKRAVVDVAVDAVLVTAPSARGLASVLAPPKKNSMLSTNAHSDPSRKVNLSDLVVLSQRKPRKLREGDFELVPALPTVIALDDMPVLDMVVDESWECVEEEDACHDVVDKRDSKNMHVKKEEQNPSYAKVLLGA